MARRKSKAGKKSFLARVPLAFFVLASLVYSFVVVYILNNVSLIYKIFFVIMGAINFLILGYSFRIKKLEARKRVFAGSLVLLVGFILLHLLQVYVNSSISPIIGFFLNISMVIGYLLLLWGMEAELK